MAPKRFIDSIYGRERPGRGVTEQGNQPRGPRDGPPNMETEFSHPPGDEQQVSSEPDEYTTQICVSVVVTTK